MEIIKVYPRGFGCNSYILTQDNQNAVVIDCPTSRVLDRLKERGLTAKYLLLTHFHFDHTAGVQALIDAGARVYCTEDCSRYKGTDADCALAFGSAPQDYVVDKTLADGECVELCGISVTTLVTDGHTKGSACYLCRGADGEKHLFTGDTLFAGTVGRTDLPTGNVGALKRSLQKLALLENMPIYPGHGDDSDLQTEKRQNPFFQF